MEIREYSYIVTVADCGSVSKAAERLFISQPSLSVYIKNLESRLGLKLFERQGKRLVLTPEGQMYVDGARRIVQLSEDLQKRVWTVKNLEAGEVRMGIPINKGAQFLPIIYPELQRLYPKVQIRIVEGISRTLEEMTLDRQLDFALINYPFEYCQLDYTELGEEEIVLAVPDSFGMRERSVEIPGCRHRWLDVKYLRDCPFILLKPGQQMRKAAEELTRRAGFEPKILMETSSAIVAYNMTRQGCGVSVVIGEYDLPAEEQAPGVSLYSVGEPRLLRKFVAAYPKNSHMTGTARAFLEEIQRIMERWKWGPETGKSLGRQGTIQK